MNLEELPEDLAIKIYTEYAPAPDPDRVFFRITIMQQVDMNIWVYMVTFVTMDGAVIPTHSRTYPRELERALRNCAKSLETTLLNSDIPFHTKSTNCCLMTAGLIGPLTKRQNRRNCCNLRKFQSFSITTKFPVPLQPNRNYLQRLVRQAMENVKTRNRISVHKTVFKGNQVVLWIALQKPPFPISSVLSKRYNNF